MRDPILPGAPGVYRVSDEPIRALTGVRMDVAAFVGVAPRGPARVPVHRASWAEPPYPVAVESLPDSLRSVAVPVESWDAYRRLFGGFEGPGRLPYAVASFFEQGGRRAYVVRIVHDYGAGDARNGHGVASGVVPGATSRHGHPVTLRARSEGSWGNSLRAALRYRTRPLPFETATPSELTFPVDAPVAAGTLLRVTFTGGARSLRFVGEVYDTWRPETGEKRRHAVFDSPLSAAPERAETVEGELEVDDGDGRTETHAQLGLSAAHPRWMAAVLAGGSSLVHPGAEWLEDDLFPHDPHLRPVAPSAWVQQFSCGRDRWADIAPEDFFDDGWTTGDELPGNGIHALVETEDVSILVVPDLYSPGPLVEVERTFETLSLAGAGFERCVSLPVEPVPPAPDVLCPDGLAPDAVEASYELDGLRLDPTLPEDLERIVALQARVVELAETLRSWIVLLDVPPGLNQRRIVDWRARFRTAWAAAYHPWLRLSRPDDARESLVSIPPSAVAAGIVAHQEWAFGVPHGPANVLARGVVSVLDDVSPARHDELHPAGVNVFLRERDGVRLSAARTLSRDPEWRQLSVRRLMTMLARTVERQMQWAVFEPNDAALRDRVTRLLQGHLRTLYRANAFRGRTDDEAYFVRCDDELNPPSARDDGRLLCHVGVAPAEPLEFLVLKIAREGDGTLRIGE